MHNHHHWFDSPWWALAFLRSFAHKYAQAFLKHVTQFLNYVRTKKSTELKLAFFSSPPKIC
jgi:hypothetical protein